MVVDIVDSTDPIRRNGDRVVIRDTMYDSLSGAFKWHNWLRCYHEDRGDGVLVLVPPGVPKDRLVTSLPERLETALVRHNVGAVEQDPGRAAATQVRLWVAVHAGEVTFDRHAVVGSAIDYTFRLAEAPAEDCVRELARRLRADRLRLVLQQRRLPPAGRPAGQLPAHRVPGKADAGVRLDARPGADPGPQGANLDPAGDCFKDKALDAL